MQNMSARMKTLFHANAAALAFLLAGSLCAPASATDLGVAPMYQAAPAPVNNWAGSYVGLSGSGAWGVIGSDFAGADQTSRMDFSGVTRVITSGYNLQNGNTVLGYEADSSVTN